MKKSRKFLYSQIVLFAFIVGACGVKIDQDNLPSQATQSPTPHITSEEKPRKDTLAVCLVGEPNSIYMYDPLNLAAEKTLSALYDGMLPGTNKLLKSSILERLPSFENGDAQVLEVVVHQGDVVVTALQTVKPLQPGDIVIPAKCHDANCVVTYAGQPLKMEQVMVNFSYFPSLIWSDGDDLTVEDSLFSFELAQKSLSPHIQELIRRTQSFEQTSDNKAQWWGIPGYLAVEPSSVFFPPLPSHLLMDVPVSELEKNAMDSDLLVGWGAYTFDHWEDGDMVLSPNPYFFEPQGNQAQFDQLTLRYLANTDEVYEEFLSGGCDVVDPSAGFEKFLPALVDQNTQKQINLQVITTPLIERLVFNLPPDHIGGTKGINPLSDPLVRAGIASCVDRYGIVNQQLKGYPAIADSFFYPESLTDYSDWSRLEHSPSEAKEYLERAGWRDLDQNPQTPRVSRGIKGIPDGTFLNLVYATSDSQLREGLAREISSMLTDCGIGVELKIYPGDQFFSQTPQGILSGGNFDLAGFAAGSYDSIPSCNVFSSQQIPSDDNGWLGVNFGGYRNPDFSTACANAYFKFPVQLEMEKALHSAHEILTFDSAAIPLFHHFSVIISDQDLCLPVWNPENPVGMHNMELVRRSADCLP